MARQRLLDRTPTGSARPLIVQGTTVHASFRQLFRLIETNFSSELADLFAEPVVGQDGSIDWYTRRDGEIRRITELSPEQRAGALGKLAPLHRQLTDYAAGLKTKPEPHQQTIGKLLDAALSHPGDEHVFMVGDHPVVAGWGFAQGGAMAEPEAMTRSAAGSPAGSPAPVAEPMVAPPSPPPLPIIHSASRFPRWLWILPLLLLLLTALFWLRSCQPEEVVAPLPPPPPPPVSEFDQRIRARGGIENAEISFSLAWANHNDLDLVVADPTGQLIYYEMKRARSGGRLDLDSNVKDNDLTSKPIEAVVWKESAPKGHYKVFVLFYRERAAGPTPFQLRVSIQGKEEVISGRIGPGLDPKIEAKKIGTSMPPSHDGNGLLFIGSFENR